MFIGAYIWLQSTRIKGVEKKGYGFPSFKTVDLKYTAENKITYYAALQIFFTCVMYTRLKYVDMNKNTPQTIKNLF